MEKIEFKDLPSTETPINADNLNLLQDNIENWLIGSRIDNVNLNDYKRTGIYYFGTNCTNTPGNFLYCLVLGSSNEPVMQIGIRVSEAYMYFRSFVNNQWTSWQFVTTTVVE